MTILVTGMGVVGRLTAEMLLMRGERVIGLDRSPHPPKGLAAEDFTYCRSDVTDGDALSRIVDAHGVSRIVHTAALLSTEIRRDPVEGLRVNILGTACILETARACALDRVVLASSSTIGYAAFASHGPAPIEEDLACRVISERPASVYAVTKLAGEHLGLLYGDLYGLDVVSLRYGAILSPVEGAPTSVPGRLLSLLLDDQRRRVVLDDPLLLWAGGEEFVDPRDCARANLHALDAAAPLQRVYNVATGRCSTLDDFVASVRRVRPNLDVEIPVRPTTGFAGFPLIRPAPSSTEAARRELAFETAYSLEDTIAYCSRD